MKKSLLQDVADRIVLLRIPEIEDWLGHYVPVIWPEERADFPESAWTFIVDEQQPFREYFRKIFYFNVLELST